MQTLQLENSEFLFQVCELIKEGHSVSIRARGNSMRPFVESDRDIAVLTHADNFSVGDVVLAEITPGHYVLHRIASIEGDKVTLRGDGNPYGTERCTVSDLKAIASQFIRKGVTWNLQKSWFWKTYSKVWVALLPIRKYLLALYRLLWLGEIPTRLKRLFGCGRQ